MTNVEATSLAFTCDKNARKRCLRVQAVVMEERDMNQRRVVGAAVVLEDFST